MTVNMKNVIVKVKNVFEFDNFLHRFELSIIMFRLPHLNKI